MNEADYERDRGKIHDAIQDLKKAVEAIKEQQLELQRGWTPPAPEPEKPDSSTLEIANLDSMEPDDLEVQADEFEAIRSVLKQLQQYCYFKASAIRARKKGHIQNAMATEAQCEAIYKFLPAWARW